MDDQLAAALQNANVVVTGAARGLGAALALALSDLGCNTILCGRSQEALAVTAGHIESRTMRKPRTIIVDLADAASVESAAKEITAIFPAVDVLIHNGAAWLGYRERPPYAAAEVLSAVNSAITGAFLFTQGLMPALQKSARPDVVTIGSVSGLSNMSLQNVSVPFYAAKHGQTALADGLRQMFLGTPIRSICIHPPWIDDVSPLDEAWNTSASRTKSERATNRDIVEAVIFAITRPRNVTIASMVIDSDVQGMDFRSHIQE
ncbi:MAG: SDR family NAD(P)-dependent oxidoreductase [Chloroflexota bacterium]